MRCPFCSNDDTKVLDSRDTEDNRTRRRRECEKCSKRFTTYEAVEAPELIIVKKDGRREPFSEEKLHKGIAIACQKRDVSTEKINNLVSAVMLELKEQYASNEVSSKQIGELVMEKLKDLDKIAYIRFASVYKEFSQVKSFEKELEQLKKN
ncbi:transcriptional repressor NrdR [Candidatus Micrarchaeota archaeon]|nr:transcriptional repressor NrdR [Candidatus Micrarchaeota archaeon]